MMSKVSKYSIPESSTYMRRQTFKEEVPKLSQLQERIAKKPIQKNEILEYMIRLQKQHRKMDERTYKKLISTQGFKEIQDEIKTHR